jgi:hypothetical protein
MHFTKHVIVRRLSIVGLVALSAMIGRLTNRCPGNQYPDKQWANLPPPDHIQISALLDNHGKPRTIYSFYVDDLGKEVKHGQELEYLWADDPPYITRTTYVFGRMVQSTIERNQ